MFRIDCSLALVLVIGLLAGSQVTAADAEFRVGNPWLSLPIHDESPRVYFAIQNPTAKSQRIVAATSPRCRSIELRIATIADGIEGSKRLDAIEIPAGGAAAFSPRGYFLVLIGSEKLVESQRVPIELELADGTKVRFAAEARDE